MFVFKRNL